MRRYTYLLITTVSLMGCDNDKPPSLESLQADSKGALSHFAATEVIEQIGENGSPTFFARAMAIDPDTIRYIITKDDDGIYTGVVKFRTRLVASNYTNDESTCSHMPMEWLGASLPNDLKPPHDGWNLSMLSFTWNTKYHRWAFNGKRRLHG
jgi:hypothetical protein